MAAPFASSVTPPCLPSLLDEDRKDVSQRERGNGSAGSRAGIGRTQKDTDETALCVDHGAAGIATDHLVPRRDQLVQHVLDRPYLANGWLGTTTPIANHPRRLVWSNALFSQFDMGDRLLDGAFEDRNIEPLAPGNHQR